MPPGAIFDHVFICTAVSAPAGDILRRFGLTEGSPNRHPGQGTACRRFFFRNAMLELIWVSDVNEAQGEQTRRTQLWERWKAGGEASPFGIILRPESPSEGACPFQSWEYRPKTMPDLVLRIALGSTVNEPMWCYMPGGRAPAEMPIESRQPMEHSVGFSQITGVRIVCPYLAEGSVTAAMANQKLIVLNSGPEHLLELEFDGGRGRRSADFRPDLPLIFRW